VETAEERAVKQRLIVRQSSLKEAVSLVVAGKADYDSLQSLAETFAEWVYKQEEPLPFDDMKDDIPY
jgi:hypothetical protein